MRNNTRIKGKWCPVMRDWFSGRNCPLFKRDCKNVDPNECIKIMHEKYGDKLIC